ncbi:MAG: MbcA/ParS/Xre antitoxin family protein [Pyrinomonadaceae bacterium]
MNILSNEMAEVTNVGMEALGDMEKFKLWLDTPNFALGNLKPMELLKDSHGKELVIGELTRIKYGILV